MSARSGASYALLAFVASGPLWAADEDEEIRAQKTPEAQLGAGLGYVSDRNTRFGQYTGLTKEGVYPLIDLDLRRRDDATGTWMNLQGRNLGLESNELRFDHQRQGNWGYFIEYGQTPRYSPYTPVTRLANPDSNNQVVNGVAVPYELEMKTLRKTLATGFDGRLTGNWNFGVRFSSEDKDGRRLFGRSGSGTTGSFQEFIVDPIDYTTRIWEANASFTDKKLQLVAAYIGTNFENHKPRLDVSGTPSSFSPIALPPDNMSHQFSVTGGYNFSQTTRSTFKAAYTNQTQNATFIEPSAVGRSDLGGKVTTLFLQGGVTSRITGDLTLLGNLRYENRDDKTPVFDYFNLTTTNTATGENEPRSIKTTNGKAEAIYRLANGYTATGGIDFETKVRNTSSVRIVSFREKTEETTLRAELRRTMSETLNGSIAYQYANRGGSDWQTTVVTSGAPGSNLVHPLQLADRTRNLVRGKLGWAASERLDVNFVADFAKDDYGGRTLGLQDGKATHFALDAGFRATDVWTATAWISQDDNKATLNSCEAASSVGVCPGTVADPIWQAKMQNTSFALGAGLRGKPRERLELGADLQWVNDMAKYDQGPLDPAIQPLPEVTVKRTTFKLFARQALDKKMSVRAQYVFDRFSSDDWNWSNYTYGDGTQVLPNNNQKVHFLALQLMYSL
jgi:MtrB/PioB family decaheme-associated outer membrane protein